MLRPMKDATRRTRSRVQVLGLGFALAFGCKTVEQLPAWEEKEPDDAQLAIFEADEPPPDAQDTSASSDGASESASEAGEPTSDTSDAAGEPSGKPKAAGNDPGPLPKPIYTQVDASCGKGPGVGQRVKGFKLETTTGKKISPGSYRNRVVLLNFWGTWCKPCLEELPEFSRLYRRYRKHGLTLVAVATDEDAGAVDEFIKSKKISAKVAIGGEGAAGEYGDRTFPFTFVVDGNGVIRAAYDGYKPKCMGKLEADIREQLGKL